MMHLSLVATVVLSLVGLPAFCSDTHWPFEVADLSDRDKLVILVFGDPGTGAAGQYRVGHAMGEVCRERGCDLGLLLGDNFYNDGIEVTRRADAAGSRKEMLEQFERKFERPYQALGRIPGFHIWAVAGNHDYRRNAVYAQVIYSEFSRLWRMPAFHYEVPHLPDWIQLYALHTDTDVHRELNGLQVASAERALCEAGRDERWKLVFGHNPVFNSGHHRGNSEERRTRGQLLTPLLLKCGVHLYFAGHAHHQEHLTATGFEQVIQGAAGRTKGTNKPPADSELRQRHFAKSFGFALVEIDRDRLRMDFYDVLNTRESGSSFDPPAADEIVRSYSFCATQKQIGRPDLSELPCP